MSNITKTTKIEYSLVTKNGEYTLHSYGPGTPTIYWFSPGYVAIHRYQPMKLTMAAIKDFMERVQSTPPLDWQISVDSIFTNDAVLKALLINQAQPVEIRSEISQKTLFKKDIAKLLKDEATIATINNKLATRGFSAAKIAKLQALLGTK